MGLKSGIELVLDNPGLDANPALVDVYFDDTVQISGKIEDYPVAEGLTVRAGSSASCGQFHISEGRLREKPQRHRYIICAAGK